MKKINLPNGAWCSISVFPKNWNTKAVRVNVPWRITYRYYPKDGKPVQRHLRDMNKAFDLATRQLETRTLLENEIRLLRAGYNPATNELATGARVLVPNTPFIQALDHIFERMQPKLAPSTVVDIRFTINSVRKGAMDLLYSTMAVSEIRRKHIKLILDHCSKSANQFNKNRSYLMTLFAELCELEAVEVNPVREIKKMKTVKRIRKILTREERQRVSQHLRGANYPFWRYMMIFYHSGGRNTELLSLRREDVDLENLRYKSVIKKGRGYIEKWRAIKRIAECSDLWRELVNESVAGQYLFSVGLKPGNKSIRTDQIGRRWKKWVLDNKELGITGTFYQFKHSNLTEISTAKGADVAAAGAGHTSPAMVFSIYDVTRESRMLDEFRNADNAF
jgi:integrase